MLKNSAISSAKKSSTVDVRKAASSSNSARLLKSSDRIYKQYGCEVAPRLDRMTDFHSNAHLDTGLDRELRFCVSAHSGASPSLLTIRRYSLCILQMVNIRFKVPLHETHLYNHN